MSSLYEIIQAILDCDWYDEETGEVDMDKKKQFDELKCSFDEKAENIVKYIKNLTAEAKILKEEEINLKQRREKKERKVENLTNYLESMMILAEKDSIEYASGEAKFRKSSAVEISDDFVNWAKENANELLTYKEPTPNKTAIKDAIKHGQSVCFAEIVDKKKLNVN